ncbi:PTS sugar transporter subunit IIA [Corynebacterium halotolerans]|uniref:Ascorbate-specific PTS system EIIA component n=1 Tax=Corynebacterium halotolerans YIM 70093 = DSM 44683 TaxID=1121362 RepID=M1NUG9_9CORY|nr:PTS sugar transporter subunit IIA [Corynebacterium halotolerans]AGF73137.1 hypothetical protein A605_10685 [Corynebacterium halotolerans YIM 70093 = DSM 44683]
MSTINELLADEAVDLDARASGWEDAVTQAGRLLERAGTIEPAYTRAMIDSVHTNGPYIVISPGFAFAHARPSEAVKETSLSWLRLAEPVEFGHEKNDPVSLVVALAAVDSRAHTSAMAELARLLGNRGKREALDRADSVTELRQILTGTAASAPPETDDAEAAARTRNKILTVCGNGLGTSLFLKNTLEQVLDTWGWTPYITVEATDTISAKGKAKESDLILTSGEIARTLGDVGVPVHVIENFTSTTEIDAAMRDLYDI